MGERRAVEPEGWARPKGYSNAVVAEGKFLFIAGQVGWDPKNVTPRFAEGFAAQFEQALKNIADILRTAGASPEGLVRVTVYVTNKAQYLAATREVGEAWRRYLGKTFPAMSLVQVAALLEDEALVEIEATGLL